MKLQFIANIRQQLLILILTLISVLNSTYSIAQRIPVSPENAILKDSLKNEVSKAPFDFSTVKPEMLYKISAKGYDDIRISFESSKKGISFPANVVDCDPCLVEYKGSPFDENVEATASFKMRKKVQEKRQTIMIGVMTPRLNMPAETVAAMVNGKKIKISNKDIHETMGYVHNLTHPLLYGLNNLFIDAYDFDEKTKDLTRMYMAKILVKPVIKSFAYRLNGKLLREYTGPASITCEWQFVYTTDTTKVLGSITTTTSLYRSAPDNNLPMRMMIFEAARDLGAIDTLFNFLERLEKSYMQKAVSSSTTISKVSEKTYPSQKEMLKGVSSAVVTIKHEEGFGSGIIIDPSGIILTNHHVVIDDTSGLMVRVEGIEELVPAKLIVLNTDYDIALLELPPGKYTALPLNTTETIEIGDAVFAIGTPIDQTLGQSVTKGIVSGFRTINGVNFIQTDVSINSGNSGGALVSENGKLVGIATMKAAGKGIEGLGFCIPSATLEQALQLKYKP